MLRSPSLARYTMPSLHPPAHAYQVDDAEYSKYWKAPVAPAAAAAAAGVGGAKFRHQWFQTADKVSRPEPPLRD